MRRFHDETAYAINLEIPSGVYYLNRGAADLVERLESRRLTPAESRKCLEAIEDVSTRQLLGRLLLPGVYRDISTAPRQLSIWFHISNSCNLACSYCYIPRLRKGVSVPVDGTTPSVDELDKIIAELFEICRQEGFEKLLLRFAGGEPTLAIPLLKAACDIAERNAKETGVGVEFAILTNGTLVTDEFIRLLTGHRFSGISISLDGGPREHDRYRFHVKPARAGTWSEITNNIKRLRSGGAVRPYILATLTAQNYSSIGELVDYCVSEELGFRLSPVRDKATSQIPGIQDEIIQTLTPIYESLPEKLPISRPIQNYANFAEWSPKIKKSVPCGTCRSSMAVSHKGDVSSCQMRLDTVRGNLNTQSGTKVFKDLAEHPSNWRFVRPNERTGGCMRCLWKYTCSGGCPEHTQMTLGTYDAPSPWCKLYGDFLPIYFRAIGTQMKIYADRESTGVAA
jgi:uncharacterized protein